MKSVLTAHGYCVYVMMGSSDHGIVQKWLTRGPAFESAGGADSFCLSLSAAITRM